MTDEKPIRLRVVSVMTDPDGGRHESKTVHRGTLRAGEDGLEIAYEQVLDDIVQRDYNDANRAVSPMRQAKDAVRVDTSGMTRDEVVADIVRRVRAAIEA